MDIYEEMLRLRKDERLSAIATIVQCIGSSPQKEGAKMLVRDDGSIIGTLGGGCMEAEVIQAALMAMKNGAPQTIPFELTEKKGGLVCGGKLLVYIEPHIPEPHLVILGAGHVGKALSKIARFVGFKVSVVDDRPEYADATLLPDADEIIVNDFETVFQRIGVMENTYIVIATRGHMHDLDAVKAALRTDAPYIGLLGSRRKKALLLQSIETAGFSRADFDRVLIPAGLPIRSVTPEEIAISIMAQVIQHRREHEPTGIGPASCSRLIQKNGAAEATPSHT